MIDKFTFLFLIAFLLLSLAGCIESTVLVTVNNDGSGKVEESFLLSSDMLQMIAGMGESFGDESGGEFDLIDQEKLKQKAVAMGGGAKLSSVEKILNNEMQGYRAVYNFTDINTLSINQNPDENISEAPSENTKKKQPTKELITFQLKKNAKTGYSVLTIINPHESSENSEERENVKGETDQASQGEMSPEMTEMFKQMFKDMKITVAVTVDGKVAKSDASYIDGSTITLIDMDFNKIIENEDAFKKLTASGSQSLEQTKQLIQSMPGIKAELKDRVTVEYK